MPFQRVQFITVMSLRTPGPEGMRIRIVKERPLPPPVASTPTLPAIESSSSCDEALAVGDTCGYTRVYIKIIERRSKEINGCFIKKKTEK